MRTVCLLFLGVFALLSLPRPAVLSPAQDDQYIRSPRLGITFISSADHPADEKRYQQALLLGAGWNRFPMYWQWIERAPGQFDWSAYDRVISDDLRHGLRTNLILIGIPEFYRDGQSILKIDMPVFSDGSDTPGAGKSINPENPWATFVHEAVNRYKPGGVLASQQGWSPDQGITIWEAWNEPDFTIFWSASVSDYARLLKVAYLAAHHADANADVMFGGLAYVDPQSNDWLAKVLAIYASDPAAPANNWYMDIVAVHNYSNAWRSGWVVQHAKRVLREYGLSRRIWLNESGVPVWDDYPGPTWAANTPDQRRLRATEQQQAAFVIQSTAYAWAAGAEVVFFHQLYDDCGNQPAGTNFPPNNGELCATQLCAGDAHGLFRNERSAVCFNQHPLPGTPRPAAAAFNTLAHAFGSDAFDGGSVLNLNNQGVVVAFDRVDQAERIYVLWNRTLNRVNLNLPADGSDAELLAMNNQDWLITPQDGAYTIGLPPATRDDYPYLASGEVSAIGGPTFILIENLGANPEPVNPALVQLEPFEPSSGLGSISTGLISGLPVQAPLQITPGSILVGNIAAEGIPTAPQSVVESPPTELPPLPTSMPMSTPVEAPPARPTVDPAQDTSAPVTRMTPLPIISPATFIVSWNASDDSGIQSYLVWVRVDGGDWQPWIKETANTQAQFTGESGRSYDFAVWAQDLAGNWSLNTELTPQASTSVQ